MKLINKFMLLMAVVLFAACSTDVDTPQINSSDKFVTPIKTAFSQKMTAILYNSDTLQVIDSGNKAFSDVLNFKARRVVWTVFKTKNTNEIFVVLNTHLSFISKNNLRVKMI